MPTSTVVHIRRFLGLVLVVAIAGTGAELLLIEHVESTKEQIPILALSLCASALIWHLIARGRAARIVLQVVMLFSIVTGVLGTIFHYESNEEFQREMDEDLVGFDLVLASLKTTSPPSLAPGVFVQIGLIGLAYAHRNDHRPRNKKDPSP